MHFPKILTNKTVLTGNRATDGASDVVYARTTSLAQSELRFVSLFPPVSGPADKMGKVVGPKKSFVANLHKLQHFTASHELNVAPSLPTGLASPQFTSKHAINYKGITL